MRRSGNTNRSRSALAEFRERLQTLRELEQAHACEPELERVRQELAELLPQTVAALRLVGEPSLELVAKLLNSSRNKS